MRFRTHSEATAFIKALLVAKQGGNRGLMTARLDSVPQWKAGGQTPPPAMDGSRISAVYLSYKKPTDSQKRGARGAKLAGIELQVIEGRLLDVRETKDGTCQVLLTNGQRCDGDRIPFRGPNVDKGILCYFSIDDGIGEPVADIIARVPQELRDRLAEMKRGTYRAELPEVDLEAAAVSGGVAVLTKTPARVVAKPSRFKTFLQLLSYVIGRITGRTKPRQKDDGPDNGTDEVRHKLK